MRYKRLRIANYRGVECCEVAFAEKGATLIQGPNEAGKTSLGEAITILFEYPDSSQRKEVKAISPAHRDVGPEIELEAQSGPYHFIYSKTFCKKPSTTLKVISPSPANFTGRGAHDKAQQILAETLDIALWKALALQQGVAIDQPDLAKQQSLSAALDKAAGGISSDPAEESLYTRVEEEYRQYFKANGQEKNNLEKARQSGDDAQSEVTRIAGILRSLDQDVEESVRLRGELVQLRSREAQLIKDVDSHNTNLREVESVECRVNEARLRLDLAKNTLEKAQSAKACRDELIKSVEDIDREFEELSRTSKEWMSNEARAANDLEAAEATLQEADKKRREADNLVDLRRADFDYYNNVLFLDQLGERKSRIDAARRASAQAAEILTKGKVTPASLKAIEEAERAEIVANARLETAAPRVKVVGMGQCALQIDGVDTVVEPDEIREFSVADRLRIVIQNAVGLEVAAGTSIDELARQVSKAQSDLQTACDAAGVGDAEAARAAFELYQQARRTIDEQDTVEQENLRDLTYDELTERLVQLESTVPRYIANRRESPAIAADLESAKIAWDESISTQQAAQAEWDSAYISVDGARRHRDGVASENEERRIQLRGLESDRDRQNSRLKNARQSESDALLEDGLRNAQSAIESEIEQVRAVEELLNAMNPEQVKALAETSEQSLITCKNRREAAQEELTEVETRLKLRGEEGLHDKLQIAESKLNRISSANRILFRRAAAARCLFDTMRRERDNARRAYLLPLKYGIERLGRLVFAKAFQVELDENLRIVSRTYDGSTVPFESLSGGTKEQLSLIFRLACSMIVAKEGGMPLILDDALGYTDSERLKLMGAVLARAAKECQIVVFTCMPERYANIGNAAIISL